MADNANPTAPKRFKVTSAPTNYGSYNVTVEDTLTGVSRETWAASKDEVGMAAGNLAQQMLANDETSSEPTITYIDANEPETPAEETGEIPEGL